jgi:hypothetical protein
MKKQIFALASIVMIGGVFMMTSCSKEDITAPVITVAGGNSVNHTLNAAWTNPTATATDDEDGDISSSISVTGTVNENLAGNYELTYTVTDAAGNVATQVVTVTVANSAAYMNGTYTNASDVCQTSGSYTYNATIAASGTTNGSVGVTNFGGFGTGITINMSVTGSSITIPAQPVGTVGNILNGSGTVSSMTAPVAFTLAWTWTDGTLTESCASTYTHD